MVFNENLSKDNAILEEECKVLFGNDSLEEHSYKTLIIHPVDMFSQTTGMECIALREPKDTSTLEEMNEGIL